MMFAYIEHSYIYENIQTYKVKRESKNHKCLLRTFGMNEDNQSESKKTQSVNIHWKKFKTYTKRIDKI